MRDPETGKGGYVPSDMKYQEWKEIYVDKASTMEEWEAKHVDKTGESGIISKKISDHVVEYYVESGATFDITILEQELQSSFVGRETEKYIEEHGLRVEIYYNYDSNGVAGGIEKNNISLYALYNEDEKELASTLVHEVSHERFHWSGTQEAKINCYIMELMHRNNGHVSTAEIQDIVSFVRENYSYLPEGDLYGF